MRGRTKAIQVVLILLLSAGLVAVFWSSDPKGDGAGAALANIEDRLDAHRYNYASGDKRLDGRSASNDIGSNFSSEPEEPVTGSSNVRRRNGDIFLSVAILVEGCRSPRTRRSLIASWSPVLGVWLPDESEPSGYEQVEELDFRPSRDGRYIVNLSMELCDSVLQQLHRARWSLILDGCDSVVERSLDLTRDTSGSYDAGKVSVKVSELDDDDWFLRGRLLLSDGEPIPYLWGTSFHHFRDLHNEVEEFDLAPAFTDADGRFETLVNRSRVDVVLEGFLELNTAFLDRPLKLQLSHPPRIDDDEHAIDLGDLRAPGALLRPTIAENALAPLRLVDHASGRWYDEQPFKADEWSLQSWCEINVTQGRNKASETGRIYLNQSRLLVHAGKLRCDVAMTESLKVAFPTTELTIQDGERRDLPLMHESGHIGIVSLVSPEGDPVTQAFLMEESSGNGITPLELLLLIQNTRQSPWDFPQAISRCDGDGDTRRVVIFNKEFRPITVNLLDYPVLSTLKFRQRWSDEDREAAKPLQPRKIAVSVAQEPSEFEYRFRAAIIDESGKQYADVVFPYIYTEQSEIELKPGTHRLAIGTRGGGCFPLTAFTEVNVTDETHAIVLSDFDPVLFRAYDSPETYRCSFRVGERWLWLSGGLPLSLARQVQLKDTRWADQITHVGEDARVRRTLLSVIARPAQYAIQSGVGNVVPEVWRDDQMETSRLHYDLPATLTINLKYHNLVETEQDITLDLSSGGLDQSITVPLGTTSVATWMPPGKCQLRCSTAQPSGWFYKAEFTVQGAHTSVSVQLLEDVTQLIFDRAVSGYVWNWVLIARDSEYVLERQEQLVPLEECSLELKHKSGLKLLHRPLNLRPGTTRVSLPETRLPSFTEVTLVPPRDVEPIYTYAALDVVSGLPKQKRFLPNPRGSLHGQEWELPIGMTARFHTTIQTSGGQFFVAVPRIHEIAREEQQLEFDWWNCGVSGNPTYLPKFMEPERFDWHVSAQGYQGIYLPETRLPLGEVTISVIRRSDGKKLKSVTFDVPGKLTEEAPLPKEMTDWLASSSVARH